MGCSVKRGQAHLTAQKPSRLGAYARALLIAQSAHLPPCPQNKQMVVFSILPFGLALSSLCARGGRAGCRGADLYPQPGARASCAEGEEGRNDNRRAGKIGIDVPFACMQGKCVSRAHGNGLTLDL